MSDWHEERFDVGDIIESHEGRITIPVKGTYLIRKGGAQLLHAEDDQYGPPTIEDDMWFHEHVRAAGYPKVKRGDVPMEGQMTLVHSHSWRGPKGITTPREIRCADCGLITDPAFKSRYDAEGCEPFELS